MEMEINPKKEAFIIIIAAADDVQDAARSVCASELNPGVPLHVTDTQ
jgi:hypothetical protein